MPGSGDERIEGSQNPVESSGRNGEAQRPLLANLSAIADDDLLGAQARRAADKKNGIRFSPSDSAARFFGRRSQTNIANYAPFARPRDAAGDARGRRIVYDYPLPDDRLLDTYKRAIDHVSPRFPLRSALLADMLGRVVSSLDRYRELRREEEEKHQNYNEEVRRADISIDEHVDGLRSEREQAAVALDESVEECIAARAAARETAAIARAAAGYGLDFGALDEVDADVVESRPSLYQPTAPQTPTAPVALPPKQVIWKVKAPDPLVTPQVPVTVEASTYKGGELKPSYVPFPISEGLARARPIEAIAIDRGLPVESPAASQMTYWSRVFGWCSLVASGIIFGISIGLLIRAIDPEMFSIRPERVILPALVLGLIGIAMFWSLGRIVSLLAALASEERHAGMLASNRLEPDIVGRWLRRTAVTTLFTLGICTVVLVAIEANVERWGIFQVFLDNAANNTIAMGAHAHVYGGPGFWTIFCLVMTVSLPFVLFHAAEGWVDARAKAIASYLRSQRAAEAWRIANDLHTERTEDVRQAVVRAEEEEAHRLAERKTNAQRLLTQAAAQAVSPPSSIEYAPSDENRHGSQIASPSIQAPVRDTDIALAIERAREANARLKEARGRRAMAIGEIDRRIAALESQRRPERVEMDIDGQRRIEDAYHDYIGAAIHFDSVYRREMTRIERLSQPGILYGLREFFFRSPN